MEVKIRKAEHTDIDLLMKWRMEVLHEVFSIPPDNLGGCAYLMNIYTCPEFRGHGAGREIVKWLIERGKGKGNHEDISGNI